MAPAMVVPILLAVLIIILIITIIAIANAGNRRRMDRRMQENLAKMKQLGEAVAKLNVPAKATTAVTTTTPVAKKKTVQRNGDKTIYDDRKNVTTWQAHLSKTFRDMKKKNPKAKFKDAMKAAKKTYKKKFK